MHLRREVNRQLGEWGENEILAEAKRRFDAYLATAAALSPDDQAVVLSIIASNADQSAFDKLHGLLRSAHNETEIGVEFCRRRHGVLPHPSDHNSGGHEGGLSHPSIGNDCRKADAVA